MKTFRKVLYLLMVLLVLGMIKTVAFSNTDYFGGEVEMIFGVLAGITLLIFVPLILLSKSGSMNTITRDEMVVSDDINRDSDDRSMLAIVGIRSILLLGLLVGFDMYINSDPKFIGDDLTMITNVFLGFVMLVILPFLLFYKTPLIHLIKSAIKVTNADKKYTASTYSVNPVDPHHNHVYEAPQFNDQTIRCPHCDSTSVTTQKQNDAKKYYMESGFKNMLSLILDSDTFKKDKYICLNCNRKW